MKRFRFALRSVATVREWREREARERLGAALHQFALAEDGVQSARRRVAELEKVLRAGRTGTFRPAEQAAFLAAYQDELSAVGRAEQVRQDAKAAVDQARERWQAARAEQRAVEQLEVRARLAHRLEGERAEQVAMDEIASMRATRGDQRADHAA